MTKFDPSPRGWVEIEVQFRGLLRSCTRWLRDPQPTPVKVFRSRPSLDLVKQHRQSCDEWSCRDFFKPSAFRGFSEAKDDEVGHLSRPWLKCVTLFQGSGWQGQWSPISELDHNGPCASPKQRITKLMDDLRWRCSIKLHFGLQKSIAVAGKELAQTAGFDRYIGQQLNPRGIALRGQC